METQVTPTDRLAFWGVERLTKRAKRGPIGRWSPGEKLHILLIGYSGGRNTGSEVRVWAMVNQFYQILGKDNVQIGLLTLSPENSADYFKPPTEFLPIMTKFFQTLKKGRTDYHLGVISEGSTLKSKWSDLLTLLFVSGAGMLKLQGKPCIAYGTGAGEMDDFLYEKVLKYCDQTYFIARDEPSLDIIQKAGFKVDLGVDTGWIFPPAPQEWAEKELKEKAGWDGKKPLLGLAVINPFCWPVYTSLSKFLRGYGIRHPEERYTAAPMTYFTFTKERREQLDRYLSNIAQATDEFVRRHDVHPIIIGMEALDDYPNSKFQKMLKTPAQIFCAKDYNGFQMVSFLRRLSMLITSRYHASVLSMPEGIPSIAVSMDERLYNIFEETDQLEDYYFKVDEPELSEKLIAAMEKLWKNQEKVREENIRRVPKYLKEIANMGVKFRNFVKENFPEFPLPPEPENWMGYLPPLYPELAEIVEKYGE
ncbi:MAG: polysaccharide pyruvyl transferase family protein [Actinomycetota bacterium]|nr:polysaccharide pyruvyl transferase family protein [Actinomycetota bacterium]